MRQPRTAFGQYELIGLLASGGMAELFLAVQSGMEGFSKVVALKRVLPHMAASEDFIQMFLDEARLAARLEHPNVVRIYDLGELNGSYFMAMEYLPGEDLARILSASKKKQQRVHPSITASIIQSAAAGLHFAHELTDEDGRPVGLVHRDVSPANIVVTYFGQTKILDFGIAKATTNAVSTRSGVLKGKFAYMAPEQVLGQPADRRSDIFALGVVMWELLTGTRLFSRDSDLEILNAVRMAEVPRPRDINPDVDSELEEVVLRALARRPEDRFQTAGEMEDALDQFFHLKTSRPSPSAIADWMKRLFGEERANLKSAIARGVNLTTSLERLSGPLTVPTLPPPLPPRRSTPPPFEDDSVDITVSGEEDDPAPVSPPRPASARPLVPVSPGETKAASAPIPLKVVAPSPGPKAGRWGGLLAGAGLVAATALGLAAALWLSSPPSQTQLEAAPRGTLELETDPPGAYIFLAGEPTGRTTPATLTWLPSGEPLRLRLEKPGYVTARDEVVIAPGETVKRRIPLTALLTRVRFTGVPSEAELFVDGERSPPDGWLELSAGSHRVEVRLGAQVWTDRTVEVGGAEQEIPLSR